MPVCTWICKYIAVPYNSIVYNVTIVSVVTTGGNINFANDSGNVAVTVNGSLHATGNITFDGNIQLGDQTTDRITFVAEVNSDKFGCYTPGTNIPIISEEEFVKMIG